MNEKVRRAVEATSILIGITSGGLSLIGSANKLPSFLLASVPAWLLLVPVAILSFSILGISKLHLSTQSIEGTSHLLLHLSKHLRKYCKRFGKRIVVYRVLPFEFSRAIFTYEEQRKRPLMDALDSYVGDMKEDRL
jgi:hypothetical protein